MSHEIRTPLNGVIGMSSMLSSTKLSEDQADFVTTIQSSAQALLSLINNILDISKIEAGKIEQEHTNFDLHVLLNSLTNMFSPQAASKGLDCALHISADTPYALLGNSMHLRQVLINLVGNAIKFTETGKIEINVCKLSQTEDKVRLRFEVVDTGIGIPDEAQSTIFGAFEQADQSITRRYGGTGLGTSISRHLVALMGGEIGFHSKTGQGTTFWFELEFEYQESGETETHTPDLIRNTRVLLVATSGKRHDSLTEHLATWQFDWDHAASAAGARAMLAKPHHYDVALIDESGLDVAAEEFAEDITSRKIAQNCKLILISQQRSSMESVRSGTAYFCVLSTPIEKSLLYNTLHASSADIDNNNAITRLSDYRRQYHPERSLKILVGEDNATNQKVIKKILEFSGHKVDIVDNGEKALDALETRRFDLVIMDLHMPNMGGIEAAQVYSFSVSSAERVPIIILTADATVEAENSAREAGVDAYLTKPIDTEKLLSTIFRLTKTAATASRELHQPTSLEHTRVDAGAQVLDLQTLKDLAELSGDIAFMRDLINGFLEDADTIIQQVCNSSVKKDTEEMQDQLHALKGSARSIGATALGNRASKIYQHLKISDRFDLDDEIEQLVNAYEETRSALTKHLENLSSAAL